MKNISLIIFLILCLFSCQNNFISDNDKKKTLQLNDEALEFMMKGDVNEAEKLYKKAFEIDNTNLNTHYALIGIYGQKKETDKAFEFLKKIPEKQKNTPHYYQTKGRIFELVDDLEKAKENYIKAYELSELVKIKDEQDLNTLIGYSMIETLAGHKNKAVNRINKTLKQKWLTQSNKDFLEVFRNEFEFYQGYGAVEFDSENEIIICTKNIDSLKIILKKHHINTSGSSFKTANNKLGKVRVNDKYRSEIEKLQLKECE